jgi:hypothetical protein
MTYTELTARDAVELIASPGNHADADALSALVQAEKFGRSTAHGATVECTGHARDASEFSAATALYRVTW